MPTCIQCGAKVEPGVASCQACGLPLPATPFAPGTIAAGSAPSSGVAMTSTALPVTAASATTVAAKKHSTTAVVAAAIVGVVLAVAVAAVIVWVVLAVVSDVIRQVDIPPLPPEVQVPQIEPPPPAEPETPRSSVPITTPGKGSDQRTALMDVARLRVEIQDRFIVHGLFVQGDRAVGDLTPEGSTDRYLVAWARTGGKWDVTWHGTPGSGSRASLEDPALGLSREIIDKLGL